MYKIGQFIELEYLEIKHIGILSQIDSKTVNIIILSSGNRWNEEIVVQDVYNLTDKDINKVACCKWRIVNKFIPIS